MKNRKIKRSDLFFTLKHPFELHLNSAPLLPERFENDFYFGKNRKMPFK